MQQPVEVPFGWTQAAGAARMEGELVVKRAAFGIGTGILVILIRVWGGLPEGVMYAILLMNALVPFIKRIDEVTAMLAARSAAVCRATSTSPTSS